MKGFFVTRLFTILMLVSLSLWRSPVIAAEKVSFWYSLLEFSVPITSLKTFAKTGKIDRHLATYIDSKNSQELIELKKALTYKLDIDNITVYRFLNSSFGNIILKALGDIIQVQPNVNGFYALRSALIMAASEPEGLTILNVLQNFPTETIHSYLHGCCQWRM